MISIPHLVKKKYKKFGSKKILYEGSQNISYKDFYIESVKFSKVLRKINIKKKDRIGICMNKGIEQSIAIVGCLFAEAIFVPILPKLNSAGIKHIIKDCEMKMIITDKFRYNELRSFGSMVNILICDPHNKKSIYNVTNLSQLRKKEIFKTPNLKNKKNDIAAIIYSSGSTGRSKGIVIPHINFVKGAKIVSKYLNTTYNDRIAGVLSLNFDYGLNQLWQSLLLGCSIFFHEFVFSKDFLNFINKNKITAIPLMPTIISMLFDGVPSVEKIKKIKNIKYICTSGGHVSLNMINKLKLIFINSKIYLMYGLTEAFRSTYLNPKKILKKPNSIGQAIPTVKIHVLNKYHRDCKVNEIGELVHRGGCVSSKYWNDAKNSLKVFRKIKRFKNEIVVFSGDLVKMDKDRDLYFIARKDQMIKTAGYRVSPTEIEEEFLEIKNIKHVLAFGMKDESLGQIIFIVYTTFNKKKIPENLLISHGKKRLPTYMIPKKFIFKKIFPTTGNQGKIDRKKILINYLKND